MNREEDRLTLAQVMAAEPEYIGTTTTIREAAEKMSRHDVGALPVVDDGQLVGIVTDRDIVLQAVARGIDTNASPVGPIASTAVVTGTPDMSVRDAAELMSQHQVRRLPVVDNGRLIGVVSMQDVAHSAGEAVVGATERNITDEAGAA